MSEPSVRQARPADQEAVTGFTEDTWDRESASDYLPDVFPEWAAERGATVARNMVFGWNYNAVAAADRHGFGPGTTVRWARPSPDPDASPPGRVHEDPGLAWDIWCESEARDWLAGLALDDEEGWALAELSAERLADMATDERAFVVENGGESGVTARVGTRETENEEGDAITVADYAVAAWETGSVGSALFAAIAADAATICADETRVCIPETTRHVFEAAGAPAALSDSPVYVLETELN